MRDARLADSQLVNRRESGMAWLRWRAPSTRSAVPSAIGRNRLGISSGGCCPSASIVTMTETPRAHAFAIPVRRAFPLPRLRGCMTSVAPVPLPSSHVPSRDPSSTTMISAAGTADLVRVMTSPIVAAAWNAGMTTPTRTSAPFEDAEHRLELGAELLDRFGGERAPCFGLELTGAPVLLDFLACPFDRVFLRIQQVLHEHDQLDLAPLVYAVPRAVLGGIQEAELTLPIAQDVRLQVGELADLADREELLDGLGGCAAAHWAPAPPPPSPSAFSSRSIRSLTACLGGLCLNNTLATSRAIGSSTPCRSPSATAVRVVLTPSTTAAFPASACSSVWPCPSATPRRVISARPRVISAARVLKPRPRPSRMPAASAITFLRAPASSTPTTSVCEYTRK